MAGCEQTYDSPEQWKTLAEAHMIAYHPELAGSPLHCRLCGLHNEKWQAGDGPGHKQRHETAHVEVYPCTHPGCTSSFNRADTLKKHMLKHSGVRFPCTWPGCTSSFTQENHLNLHMKKHAGVKVKCTWPGCGKEFADETKMKTHFRSIHEGERWPCALCSSMPTAKNDLRKHIKAVHPEADLATLIAEARPTYIAK